VALNNETIKLEIKGIDGAGLQEEILKDLDQVEMRIESKKVVGDNEIVDDVIVMKPFNVEEIKKKYKTEPQMMTNLPTNNQDKWTGIEAIIEAIVERLVDKVVDRMVDNILNKMVITIPVGTVITAVSGGSGSPAVGTPNPSPIECNKE